LVKVLLPEGKECGVALAASQKNPNKFGFSFDLHYLCTQIFKKDYIK